MSEVVKLQKISELIQAEFKEPGLENYEHLRITDLTDIEEPIPVINIEGETISTAENITVISGQSKSGKSAFLSPIIAGAISSNVQDPFDGLEVLPTDGKAVVHIDTEQARHKHKKSQRGVIKRAGLNECPPNYLSYNFRGIATVSESIDTLDGICQAAADQFGGIHLIVIDGIADLANDVNDPAESNKLVRHVEALAVKYSCPVIVVLHLNPGTDKERGHLGSQLQRKAESVLRVKQEGDISTLEPVLLRMAGKGNIPLIQFQYDASKGYHMFTGHASKNGRNGVDYQGLAREILGNGLTQNYTAIVNLIMEKTGKALRTCKGYLRDLVELEIIQTDGKGNYWCKVQR